MQWGFCPCRKACMQYRTYTGTVLKNEEQIYQKNFGNNSLKNHQTTIGNYEVKISLKLHELYHLIGLQNEIIQKLRVICEKIHLGQMDEYLDKLMDGKTAAQSYEELKTVLAEDKDNLKMLYCQLECARRVFDRYQEKTEECF